MMKPVYLHVGAAEVDLHQSGCGIVCGFLRRGAFQGHERRQRLRSDYLVHVQV